MHRTLCLLLCLLVASPGWTASAQPRDSATVAVTALAVSETADGLEGVSAEVRVTVLAQGSGAVFVSTKPLAETDMQGSARLAAKVAAATVGATMTDYDYLVGFSSESTVIGGPSAGAVMTLALATALHNVRAPDDPWTLDPSVAATGTINPDGTIGPVGGVPEKAEAAAAAGIRTFLFPAGLEVATTVVPGPFGPQREQVEMDAHCDGLGIRCRPAALVTSLIEAAAHVDLVLAPAPEASTSAYGEQLAPSVEAQVLDLERRIEALPRPVLEPAQRQRIDQEAEAALQRSEGARRALGEGAYYLAATRGFQGHIFIGRAENLTRFYEEGRSEEVVLGAIATCREAAGAARLAAQGPADTLHRVYALAAAQDRARHAEALAEEAGALHAGARTFWPQSLEVSAFCHERAKTVSWWAGLADAFGPGPAVPDLSGLADDVLDQARELVTYAQAVTGGAAAAAAGRLMEAEAMRTEGRLPGAIAAATEAQAKASVAVQAAAGATVPPAVLEAARDGTGRAIASARARGVEPVLAVSMVELAAEQEPAEALESLWTARGLALLQADTPVAPRIERSEDVVVDGDPLLLVLVAVVGAATAIMVVAWAVTRPRW